MARLILKYSLNAGSEPQAIDMPRRARVLYVCMGEGGPQLFAEVLEDADTKAFDVKHLRHFVVVTAGGTIPEGAGYIGSCHLQVAGTRHLRSSLANYHVFEARGRKATPL